MTYSTRLIANNILRHSFKEELLVTPMKLQRVLYFVAAEYQKMTNQPLLAELFCTWAYGPVTYSVYDQFRNVASSNVNQYVRDVFGSTFCADESRDIELKAALDRVWFYTKSISAIELSEIARLRGSAWDRAFQAGAPVLYPDDIARDTTYRVPLGLEVA